MTPTLLNLPVKRPAELAAGLVLIALGTLGAVLASELPFGTLLRMRAGLAPFAVSLIVIALGVAVMLSALLPGEGGRFGRWQWRPMLGIGGAIVIFAAALKPAGFLIACFAAVAWAGLARAETRWPAHLAFAAGLALFAGLLFVHALGLPFVLLPGT